MKVATTFMNDMTRDQQVPEQTKRCSLATQKCYNITTQHESVLSYYNDE